MPFSADFNKWYDANYEDIGDDHHRRTAWAGWQAAKDQYTQGSIGRIVAFEFDDTRACVDFTGSIRPKIGTLLYAHTEN